MTVPVRTWVETLTRLRPDSLSCERTVHEKMCIAQGCKARQWRCNNSSNLGCVEMLIVILWFIMTCRICDEISASFLTLRDVDPTQRPTYGHIEGAQNSGTGREFDHFCDGQSVCCGLRKFQAKPEISSNFWIESNISCPRLMYLTYGFYAL